MTQKLLFLVFSHDACRVRHALMYALDLARHGHQVRIILEGEATALLGDRAGRLAELLGEAVAENLVEGACATAARGCATGDALRNLTRAAEEAGLTLLGDLDGHAGIERFVQAGYQVVTF